MEKRLRSIFPLLLLISANLIGMFTLLNDGNADGRMIIMCVGMCVLSFVVYLLINLCGMGDTYLFLIITMLATVGIIITTSLNPDYGSDNMKMYLGGVVLFFVTILVYRILYKHLKQLVLWYFAASVILYAATLLFGVGKNGAKNWLSFGAFSLQPSEFIKVLFILTIAGVLTYTVKKEGEESAAAKRYTSTLKKREKKTLISRRAILITAVTYINIGFLMIQTELGTSIILFAVYLAFLFAYDKNNMLLLINTAVLAAAIVFVVTCTEMLPAYLESRINGWLSPFETRAEGGNYIVKSLSAIHRGGFSGVGIGNGHFNMDTFVSLHTDYIFCALCKETGILGGIGVIMLYFVLVYRGFKIAVSTTNDFNKAVAFGISTMLGVQTFIITGGVTGLIPLTGITLPFISYGGSSMFSTFIMVGMLQAISGVKGDTTDEIE